MVVGTNYFFCADDALTGGIRTWKTAGEDTGGTKSVTAKTTHK